MSQAFWLPDTRNLLLRYIDGSGIIHTPVITCTDPVFVGNGGFTSPWGMAADRKGHIFVNDLFAKCVYMLDTTTLVMIRVAGKGNPANPGAGALGWTFVTPYALACDSQGNIYIGDDSDRAIVAVNMQATTQTILGVSIPAGGAAYVVAGTAGGGFAGDGLLASDPTVQLRDTYGIAFDSHDNLYFADQDNFRIRRVDAVTGIITTVVGSGPVLPTINTGDGGYSGDGGPPTSAEINSPLGLCFDSADNLYILDTYNNVIRVVNYQLTAQTLLGTTVAAGTINTIAGYTSPVVTDLWAGAINSDGTLMLCDMGNHVTTAVTGITSSGSHVTLAGNGTPGYSGDGGPATSAEIGEAFGLALVPEITARIHTVKATIPGGSTQPFTFNPSWGSAFVLHDGQSNDSGALAPGTYSITEDAVSNWSTAITVSNGDSPSAITLGSGDTVTVTFTNSLTVPICFADGIIPAGAIDGINASFTLPSSPNPPGSLILESDTSILAPGVGFSLSFVLNGAQLTLTYPPKTSLVAWYRTICGSQVPPLYKLNPDQAFDDNAFTSTPTAINSTYFTYGFVNAAKAAQNPLLGFHRKRFSEIQMNVNGSGQFIVTTFPNYILKKDLSYNPYAYVVPPILLQTDPPDDLIRPLNSVGNRVYVKFETNAVGASFDISKTILIGVMDSYNVVNPNV